MSDNPSSVLRALVAHAVAESGDIPGAVALLGPPPDPGGRNYASRAGACLRLAVFALAGDRAAVSEARARMTEMDLDPEVVTYGSIDCLGSVDYFLALADEAVGDRDGARTHTRAALPSTGGSGTARGVAAPRHWLATWGWTRTRTGASRGFRNRGWSAESERLAVAPRLGGIPDRALPEGPPS